MRIDYIATSNKAADCIYNLPCRWRELNAARDWLEAERKLRPLSLSLPLLLHHKQQVCVRLDTAAALESAAEFSQQQPT